MPRYFFKDNQTIAYQTNARPETPYHDRGYFHNDHDFLVLCFMTTVVYKKTYDTSRARRTF